MELTIIEEYFEVEHIVKGSVIMFPLTAREIHFDGSMYWERLYRLQNKMSVPLKYIPISRVKFEERKNKIIRERH